MSIHRIDEIEYRLERMRDDIQRMLAELARMAQMLAQLAGGAGARGGGGSAPMFGFADGDISGRSGMTLGSGVVVRYKTTGGTLVETEEELTVYNPGELISDGKLCVVEKDANGTLIVGPIECEEEE